MREVIFLSGIYPHTETDFNINYMRPIACYQLKWWISHFGIHSKVIEWCQFHNGVDLVNMIQHCITDTTHTIACTATFWPYNGECPTNIRYAMNVIKQTHPNISWAVGSPFSIIGSRHFDVTFIGESEDKFVEYCQYKQQIYGKTLFNTKFNIVKCAHRFDHTDGIVPGEVLPIEFGRGCIFKCSFCSNPNLGKPKRTYQREFAEILDEMRWNYEQFGVTKYTILDDTINEDVDKVANMATFSKELWFDVSWVGYLRADLIWSNPQTAEQLQRSGLVSPFFGIETFNLAAGKAIGKAWAAKHAKTYLPYLYHELWGAKINMVISLIAGIAGESESNLLDTIDWCEQNDLGWYVCNPLYIQAHKQSEFLRDPAQWGYTLRDQGRWSTDSMTFEDAQQLANILTQRVSSSNRISGWSVATAMNLGAAPVEVMKMHSIDLTELINVNGKSFVDHSTQLYMKEIV